LITERELQSYLSTKLCEMGSVLLKYYNCCDLKGSSCKVSEENPCCLNAQYGTDLCPFWQHGACQYENCDCRLWICETAIKTTDPKCVEGLKKLEEFAKLFGLVRTALIGARYSGADKQPVKKSV
jgi:hypothetical protein